MKKNLRVGVLMGGKSHEREVSFNSGRTICDHLDTNCYDIIPIFQTKHGTLYRLPWTFLHRGKISDFEHRLASQAQQLVWDQLKNCVDFVYIATHGRYAEDGTLQGMLELLQIPYFGSKVFASALGMEKIEQKKILQMHSINVARGVAVQPEEINHQQTILKRLKNNKLFFPLVVKPVKEGSSLGLSIAKIEQELFVALGRACHVNKQPQTVLVEEKIEGMEFSCIVITSDDGKLVPLAPTEIVTPQEIGFHDYEQKYMPGKSLQYTPARCTQEQQQNIQSTCLAVMHALEFSTIGRIDGFLKPDGTVVIIDPNSFSGAAPSSFLFRQAAEHNLNHTQLINHFIKTELRQYAIGANMKPEKSNSKDKNKKNRVAIIMGGNSDEKEISLESGRNVTYKLSPEKYEAVPLFLSSTLELFRLNARMLVSNTTKEVEALCKPQLAVGWHELPSLVDFVFIGLHGAHGENGCVQGALELLGLPYNGSSVLASALCMDKFKTNQLLGHEGFEVPQAFLVTKNEWEQDKTAIVNMIVKKLPLPCIVKPPSSGCSMFVQKVSTPKALQGALENIFEHKQQALIEELVAGMELTVGVIGNQTPQALPPSNARSAESILSIEEKFLPGAGENQTPAPLPKRALHLVQKSMEHVYKALNCKGYARIDCFYQTARQSPTKKERVVVLEVNTLPGLTPATCIFHQAAEIGLKPMDFIDLLVRLGFEEHGNERRKKLVELVPQNALKELEKGL